MANPYEALAAGEPKTASIVSARAVAFVVGSTILAGAFGMAIGAFLGLVFPGYYRAIFAGSEAADFDPLAVGVGLGLTQGLLAGLVGSIALLWLTYFLRTREARRHRDDRERRANPNS